MDGVVYVSSLSSSPSSSSSSSSFENRLHEPIILNPKTDYEMGLVDVVCPDTYYSLFPGDSECAVDLMAYIQQSDLTYITFPLGSVTPSVPLCAANMSEVLQTMNSDISELLKRRLGGAEEYKKYFLEKNFVQFFSWHGGRIILRSVQDDRSAGEAHTISEIFLQFSTKIADVLGFQTSTWYTLYKKQNKSEEEEEEEGSYRIQHVSVPNLPRKDGGVSCILAYCDRIAPSSFGDQLVPILDIWKTGKFHEKRRINYVDMNTHQMVESISIA